MKKKIWKKFVLVAFIFLLAFSTVSATTPEEDNEPGMIEGWVSPLVTSFADMLSDMLESIGISVDMILLRTENDKGEKSPFIFEFKEGNIFGEMSVFFYSLLFKYAFLAFIILFMMLMVWTAYGRSPQKILYVKETLIKYLVGFVLLMYMPFFLRFFIAIFYDLLLKDIAFEALRKIAGDNLGAGFRETLANVAKSGRLLDALVYLVYPIIALGYGAMYADICMTQVALVITFPFQAVKYASGKGGKSMTNWSQELKGTLVAPAVDALLFCFPLYSMAKNFSPIVTLLILACCIPVRKKVLNLSGTRAAGGFLAGALVGRAMSGVKKGTRAAKDAATGVVGGAVSGYKGYTNAQRQQREAEGILNGTSQDGVADTGGVAYYSTNKVGNIDTGRFSSSSMSDSSTSMPMGSTGKVGKMFNNGMVNSVLGAGALMSGGWQGMSKHMANGRSGQMTANGENLAQYEDNSYVSKVQRTANGTFETSMANKVNGKPLEPRVKEFDTREEAINTFNKQNQAMEQIKQAKRNKAQAVVGGMSQASSGVYNAAKVGAGGVLGAYVGAVTMGGQQGIMFGASQGMDLAYTEPKNRNTAEQGEAPTQEVELNLGEARQETGLNIRSSADMAHNHSHTVFGTRQEVMHDLPSTVSHQVSFNSPEVKAAYSVAVKNPDILKGAHDIGAARKEQVIDEYKQRSVDLAANNYTEKYGVNPPENVMHEIRELAEAKVGSSHEINSYADMERQLASFKSLNEQALEQIGSKFQTDFSQQAQAMGDKIHNMLSESYGIGSPPPPVDIYKKAE